MAFKSLYRDRIRVVTKKQFLRCFSLALGCLALAGAAFAQGTTVTNTFTVNKAIPDGNSSGLSDTQTLNFVPQQLFAISDLQVTLNITGGFNGDYYGYLVHNGGFAVLLNRVGRSASNPVGYADGGLNITLSAASPNDIHTYQSVSNPGGGLLSGIFNADGRNVDPANVLDSDASTALLGSFDGQDPSGQWTLFLADLDYGEQGQLASWGLVVTAVPEPTSVGLLALGLGGAAAARRWRQARRS